MKNEKLFEWADTIIMQLEIPVDVVMTAAKKGKELGKYVILNPAPAQKLPCEIFKYVDALIPNEHEAEQLLGYEITEKTYGNAIDEFKRNKKLQRKLLRKKKVKRSPSKKRKSRKRLSFSPRERRFLCLFQRFYIWKYRIMTCCLSQKMVRGKPAERWVIMKKIMNLADLYEYIEDIW